MAACGQQPYVQQLHSAVRADLQKNVVRKLDMIEDVTVLPDEMAQCDVETSELNLDLELRIKVGVSTQDACDKHNRSPCGVCGHGCVWTAAKHRMRMVCEQAVENCVVE